MLVKRCVVVSISSVEEFPWSMFNHVVDYCKTETTLAQASEMFGTEKRTCTKVLVVGLNADTLPKM